jgi:hypothetical protein
MKFGNMTKSVKHHILKTKSYKLLNPYQQDFTFASAVIEDNYPNLYTQIDSIKYLIYKTSILNALDTVTSKQQFALQLQKFLAFFHNQHTLIINYNPFYPDGYVFPCFLYPYQSNWHVFSISNKYDSVLIGNKVLKINNFSIEIVEKRISEYVCQENETAVKFHIARNELLLNRTMLKTIGVLTNPDTVDIELETSNGTKNIKLGIERLGESKPYTLNNKTQLPTDSLFAYQINEEQHYAYLQWKVFQDKHTMLDGVKTYLNPIYRPFVKLYIKKQYRKKQVSEKLKTMIQPNVPDFNIFLKQMFKQMNQKGITNLIVDLRHNGGGDYRLGGKFISLISDSDVHDFVRSFIYTPLTRNLFSDYCKLAQHIYKQQNKKDLPYNEILINNGSELNQAIGLIPESERYKGKIILLTGSDTNSAAAHFSVAMQDNKLATVVGLPVANNANVNSTLTPIKLKNTDIVISFSSIYLQRPDTLKGIYFTPDYYVERPVDDFYTGHDKVFEKALELIK